MAQFPGKPIIYQVSADSLAADTTFTLTVGTTGVVGDGAVCDSVGDEYNPLAEIDKYGQPNPYQDPARGRINGGMITTDSTGAIAIAPSSENVVLLNLEGKDGILGRSITRADANGSACCVIARDALPEQFAEPEFYPKGN